MMLEELQRRNYSAITTRNYLRVVTEFAKYFGKSPDKLGPNQLRTYQAYLLTECKLTPGTVIIRVAEGKGGKDRDLRLSPSLLETLREYWRWRKPKTYLFPSRDPRRGPEQPISDKTVWIACSEAARRAGIRKRVTPHTLRHSW